MARSSHFIEIKRHLEDLDNRGRQNNIRGRGIPESVEAEQIPALQRLFNSLLEREEDTGIDFVQAHRALRTRGPDTAPHRNICCLQSFPPKEDIMHKARRNEHIIFNGASIMLFQDLLQPCTPCWTCQEKKELIHVPLPLCTGCYSGGKATLTAYSNRSLRFLQSSETRSDYTPRMISRVCIAIGRQESTKISTFLTREMLLKMKEKKNRGSHSNMGTPNPRPTPSRSQDG